MSYSALRDIETCPLRWGLRHAAYPHVWSGAGYPPCPAPGTIAGQVVHIALERILLAVGAARAAQPADLEPAAASDPLLLVVGALRALGGISVVLDGVMHEIVAAWESNPRLTPRAKELASDLQRQLPALRPRVQHFLHRVDLGRVHPSSGIGGAPGAGSQEIVARPLGPGLYAEVPLVNEELGWFGKADLLRVSAAEDADKGEIVDFKTGLPKPDHQLQLRIYALLWARDKRLNPTGVAVQRLTLLYGSGPVEVPAPTTDDELDRLAHQLAERTSNVREAIRQHPPEARPSREACEWCDVRHMCPAYWTPAARAAVVNSPERPQQRIDAGVHIVGKQGAWSWVARVQEVGALSDGISVGTRVLLRARPHDVHFTSLLQAGTTIRILAAQCVAPSEESGGLPILSLTRFTEAFIVDGSGNSP